MAIYGDSSGATCAPSGDCPFVLLDEGVDTEIIRHKIVWICNGLVLTRVSSDGLERHSGEFMDTLKYLRLSHLTFPFYLLPLTPMFVIGCPHW